MVLGKRRPMVAIGIMAISAMTLTACGGTALGSSSGTSGPAESAPVKVGLIVAQSGVYADIGADMEHGVELYLAQHDNKLGNRTVELTTVDEGDNPQVGVAAATRLVNQEQVDVAVGIVSGATAAGSAPIFTAAKTPVVFGNSGSLVLGDKLASPFIYRANYANDQPGAVIGAYLKEKLSADEKVFLIGPDYSGGHEILGGFKAQFPQGQIAGELYPPFAKTSDYSPYLAKIQQSGVKNVFAFFAGSEAINFTKQFDQFGLASSVQLYATGDLTEGDALGAEGDTAKGIQTVLNYNYDIDTPVNKEFVPAFEKKYDDHPTVRAAVLYDIMIMLDKAIGSIPGDISGQAIADALAKSGEVQGVRGDIKFDATRTIVQDWYLRDVKEVDGKLTNVLVETMPSDFVNK